MATGVPEKTVEVLMVKDSMSQEEYDVICPDSGDLPRCQLEIIDLAEEQTGLNVIDDNGDRTVEVYMVEEQKCDKKIKVMMQSKSVHFVSLTFTPLANGSVKKFPYDLGDCYPNCEGVESSTVIGPTAHTIWDLAKHQEARIPILDVGGDSTGSYYEFPMTTVEHTDTKFVSDRNDFFGQSMVEVDSLPLIDFAFWNPALNVASTSCTSIWLPDFCKAAGPGCWYYGDEMYRCEMNCSDSTTDSDSTFPGITFTAQQDVESSGDAVGSFVYQSHKSENWRYVPLYGYGFDSMLTQTECSTCQDIGYHGDHGFGNKRMSVLNSSGVDDRLWGTLNKYYKFYKYNSIDTSGLDTISVAKAEWFETNVIKSLISGLEKAFNTTEELNYTWADPPSGYGGFVSGSWQSNKSQSLFIVSHGSAYRKAEHPDNFEYPYQLIILHEDYRLGQSIQENNPLEVLDDSNVPCEYYSSTSYFMFHGKIGPSTITGYDAESFTKVYFKYMDDTENTDPWSIPTSTGLASAFHQLINDYTTKFDVPSSYRTEYIFFPTEDFWFFGDIIIKDFVPV